MFDCFSFVLLLATVFHTKRGNNCVFDSLLDFSRIICPRVMMYHFDPLSLLNLMLYMASCQMTLT